jgi:hypothetical protein
MRTSRAIVVLIPLIFVLAACAAATHVAAPHPTVVHHSPKPSATPTLTPTPTATATAKATVPPPIVNSADYLIDGTPNVPDSSGEWFGEWAFFTDSTKTVWCEFAVFSADNPGASCSIVPSAESQATYPRPAGSSTDCSTSDWDGYTLALGAGAEDLPNADAGWDQCINLDPDTAGYQAKSKVLPNGATIAFAPISCTTSNGIGTCVETNPGSPSISITLGLHTASFHSTS